MQGACIKAPEAILARHDGHARAAAARRLAVGAAQSEADADADEAAADPEDITRTCRRILLQMTLVKVSRCSSKESQRPMCVTSVLLLRRLLAIGSTWQWCASQQKVVRR